MPKHAAPKHLSTAYSPIHAILEREADLSGDMALECWGKHCA